MKQRRLISDVCVCVILMHFVFHSVLLLPVRSKNSKIERRSYTKTRSHTRNDDQFERNLLRDSRNSRKEKYYKFPIILLLNDDYLK